MSSHRDRYREIAETLSRHGMGLIVDLAGLEQLVPFHRGLLGHERRAEPYTRPEHVRLALEQLGTTFIKLGQVLSTRPDLVGEAYATELAKLRDSAPAVPPSDVLEAVASELGSSVGEAFRSFDREPLAAASIGQAHAAVLHDGTEVVVKVRRPGVVEQVEQDIEILHNLAARAQHRWEGAARYDLVGLAGEFALTLRAELDYLQEARSAERFAAAFRGDHGVHIPRVFWQTTTSRVLTLERMRGTNVADVAALDAAGIDRPLLAERATRVVAQMVFDDGFFHADPHPGNFFIERDATIGLIDFGLVGEVDAELRDRLGALLVGLASEDADRITTAVLRLTIARGPVSRTRLRADLERLVRSYSGQAIGDLPLGALIREVLGILRRNDLQLPAELALLIKTVVMLEGLGARLNPDFRFGEVLAPYAQRFVAHMLSPAAVIRRLQATGLDVAQLGLEFPEHLRRLLDLLENDGLQVRLSPDELRELASQLRRREDRLAAAVVVAALVQPIVDLALAARTGERPRTRPLLAAGVTAAVVTYLLRSARSP